MRGGDEGVFLLVVMLLGLLFGLLLSGLISSEGLFCLRRGIMRGFFLDGLWLFRMFVLHMIINQINKISGQHFHSTNLSPFSQFSPSLFSPSPFFYICYVVCLPIIFKLIIIDWRYVTVQGFQLRRKLPFRLAPPPRRPIRSPIRLSFRTAA